MSASIRLRSSVVIVSHSSTSVARWVHASLRVFHAHGESLAHSRVCGPTNRVYRICVGHVKDLMVFAGLVVMLTAVTGILAGAAMSIGGSVARNPRVGIIGARLALGGPGLTCVGAGLYAAGLPWPATAVAVLPMTFGVFLLWAALRAQVTFVGRAWPGYAARRSRSAPPSRTSGRTGGSGPAPPRSDEPAFAQA
jgi:hypothetical protein